MIPFILQGFDIIIHIMEKRLLENLSLPQDLKKLSKAKLEQLAIELREKIIEIGDVCGGHIASNLGVVELTLALHTVFDSPKDQIVWDVAHQCYPHKMLTGRQDKILTIRQFKGLSGFTKISESEHDVFGAGHSSTSISAALGLAHARDLQHKKNAVIAVIGDSSFANGMAFEALNNVEKLKTNFICILNDNDMSISKPIGSMSKYITSVRTSQVYNKAKRKFEKLFKRIPKIGVPLTRRIEKMVERLRHVVLDMKFDVLFEEFGFKYLGPLDGHDVLVMMAALKYAKSYKGPIMLHVITQKGKGYTPAEDNPTKYHGIQPKKNKGITSNLLTYQEVFGEEMLKIAKKRKEVVAITPAMTEGSGLVEFAKKYAKRFYDVGIAEGHAVTFAAGLARGGLKPVLTIYSTFLQRGFDQVVHDVCLQNLGVVLAIDRAGFVGADGPTHHGIFDYSYLLPIPNLTILAPKDGTELRQMLNWAMEYKGPVSIRYPRSRVPLEDGTVNTKLSKGKAEVIFENRGDKTKKPYQVLLLAAGSMVWPAVRVTERLDEKKVSVAVINLRFIKPLDIKLLKEYVEQAKLIYVLEEGSVIGGVYAYILEQLDIEDSKARNMFKQIALPDKFLEHGSVDQLKDKYGLSEEKILARILGDLSILPKSV